MDNCFSLWVVEVGAFEDLVAEVVTTGVGGIEVVFHVFALTDEVVDQCASVTS